VQAKIEKRKKVEALYWKIKDPRKLNASHVLLILGHRLDPRKYHMVFTPLAEFLKPSILNRLVFFILLVFN